MQSLSQCRHKNPVIILFLKVSTSWVLLFLFLFLFSFFLEKGKNLSQDSEDLRKEWCLDPKCALSPARFCKNNQCIWNQTNFSKAKTHKYLNWNATAVLVLDKEAALNGHYLPTWRDIFYQRSRQSLPLFQSQHCICY